MYLYNTKKGRPVVHVCKAFTFDPLCKSYVSPEQNEVTPDFPENGKPCKTCAKHIDERTVPRKPRRKVKKVRGDKFYDSWEWKKLRYKVILKHGRQCMCCGDRPPGVKIVVDHIKPRTKFPELELVQGNLQVLCESCNMGKSNKDYTDFRV